MSARWTKSVVVVTLIISFLGMEAQMLPYPYGAPISNENAKKAAAAALAEAAKNHWVMAVAIVDPSGTLVYYEKTDNTQIGSAEVAVAKARSAALFKRPTKAFQDAVAQGGAGLRILGLPGAVPVEGGEPIIVDGKDGKLIIGAIGVSGGQRFAADVRGDAAADPADRKSTRLNSSHRL